MKTICGKSIAINPPVRRLSLSAGFHALTTSARFAEELIERYSRVLGEYADSEAFVFLKNLNRELDREKSKKDELTLILRLMIIRQLIVTNRMPGIDPGSAAERAVSEQLSILGSGLRTTDRRGWQQLNEYRKLIENDEKFSEYIHESNVVHDSFRETLSFVDVASIGSDALLPESGTQHYEVSSAFVFRLLRDDDRQSDVRPAVGVSAQPDNKAGADRQASSNLEGEHSDGNNKRPAEQYNTEFQPDIQAAVSETPSHTGKESEKLPDVSGHISAPGVNNLNVSGEYAYQNSDIVLKNEQSENRADEKITHPSADNQAGKDSGKEIIDGSADTAGQPETQTGQVVRTDISNGNILNVSGEYAYQNSDIVLKNEQSENKTDEKITHPATDNQAGKDSLKEINDRSVETAGQPETQTGQAVRTDITNGSVLNVSGEYAYQNSDIVLKNEQSENKTDENITHPSADTQTGKDSGKAITDSSAETAGQTETKTGQALRADISNGSILNVSGEYAYQHSDIVLKNEQSENKIDEKITHPAADTQAGDNSGKALTDRSAETAGQTETKTGQAARADISNGSVLNVSGEYAYQNSDFVLKNEQSENKADEKITHPAADNQAGKDFGKDSGKSVADRPTETTGQTETKTGQAVRTDIAHENILNVSGEYAYQHSDIVLKNEQPENRVDEKITHPAADNQAGKDFGKAIIDRSSETAGQTETQTGQAVRTDIAHENILNVSGEYAYQHSDIVLKNEQSENRADEKITHPSADTQAGDNSGKAITDRSSETTGQTETQPGQAVRADITNGNILNVSGDYAYQNSDIVLKNEQPENRADENITQPSADNQAGKDSGKEIIDGSAETAGQPKTQTGKAVRADIGHENILNVSGEYSYQSSDIVLKNEQPENRVGEKITHPAADNQAGKDSGKAITDRSAETAGQTETQPGQAVRIDITNGSVLNVSGEYAYQNSDIVLKNEQPENRVGEKITHPAADNQAGKDSGKAITDRSAETAGQTETQPGQAVRIDITNGSVLNVSGEYAYQNSDIVLKNEQPENKADEIISYPSADNQAGDNSGKALTDRSAETAGQTEAQIGQAVRTDITNGSVLNVSGEYAYQNSDIVLKNEQPESRADENITHPTADNQAGKEIIDRSAETAGQPETQPGQAVRTDIAHENILNVSGEYAYQHSDIVLKNEQLENRLDEKITHPAADIQAGKDSLKAISDISAETAGQTETQTGQAVRTDISNGSVLNVSGEYAYQNSDIVLKNEQSENKADEKITHPSADTQTGDNSGKALVDRSSETAGQPETQPGQAVRTDISNGSVLNVSGEYAYQNSDIVLKNEQPENKTDENITHPSADIQDGKDSLKAITDSSVKTAGQSEAQTGQAVRADIAHENILNVSGEYAYQNSDIVLKNEQLESKADDIISHPSADTQSGRNFGKALVDRSAETAGQTETQTGQAVRTDISNESILNVSGEYAYQNSDIVLKNEQLENRADEIISHQSADNQAGRDSLKAITDRSAETAGQPETQPGQAVRTDIAHENILNVSGEYAYQNSDIVLKNEQPESKADEIISHPSADTQTGKDSGKAITDSSADTAGQTETQPGQAVRADITNGNILNVSGEYAYQSSDIVLKNEQSESRADEKITHPAVDNQAGKDSGKEIIDSSADTAGQTETQPGQAVRADITNGNILNVSGEYAYQNSDIVLKNEQSESRTDEKITRQAADNQTGKDFGKDSGKAINERSVETAGQPKTQTGQAVRTDIAHENILNVSGEYAYQNSDIVLKNEQPESKADDKITHPSADTQAGDNSGKEIIDSSVKTAGQPKTQPGQAVRTDISNGNILNVSGEYAYQHSDIILKNEQSENRTDERITHQSADNQAGKDFGKEIIDRSAETAGQPKTQTGKAVRADIGHENILNVSGEYAYQNSDIVLKNGQSESRADEKITHPSADNQAGDNSLKAITDSSVKTAGQSEAQTGQAVRTDISNGSVLNVSGEYSYQNSDIVLKNEQPESRSGEIVPDTVGQKETGQAGSIGLTGKILREMEQQVNGILKMNTYLSQGTPYFARLNRKYSSAGNNNISKLVGLLSDAALSAENGLILKAVKALNEKNSEGYAAYGAADEMLHSQNKPRGDNERTELLITTVRKLDAQLSDNNTSLTQNERRLLRLLQGNGRSSGELVRAAAFNNDSALSRELTRYYGNTDKERSTEAVRQIINSRYIKPSDASDVSAGVNASGAYGYSGYPLISLSGAVFPSDVPSVSNAAGSYSGTESRLQYSGQRGAVKDRGEIINATVPRTQVIKKEELVRRFGNLIDGADPNAPQTPASVSGVQSGSVIELSARVNKMDEQTRYNTKRLEELTKKQREFEASVLTTNDVKQLSEEMIGRLRSKLRLEKSRYS